MPMEPVTTCPSAGVQKGLSYELRVRLPLKENTWSRHQCLFEENIEKTKMEKVEGLCILKMRVRESFTHGEGISTPHARHKGWQPLIERANYDFNIIYFSFYLLFSLFMFFLCIFPFMFFTFFGVDKGVSLAPTYPRVR